MNESIQIQATGHTNVTARHRSTLVIRSDDYLTPAGDCIAAINADMTPADLDRSIVDRIQDPTSTITMQIESSGHVERIRGRGHPDLILTNERGFVARTSTYVDDRTLMVSADGAARDLDRDLVDALAAGEAVTIIITVDR